MCRVGLVHCSTLHAILRDARYSQPIGMLVTCRWIIERCSTTRFMVASLEMQVSHSAMKKLPRKGGHRSAKQDRRNPRFSGQLVILYEDDALVALNKPAGTSSCACERLRYTVRIVSAFCRTETEETTSLCRTSHRSFYVRGSALCKNRAGSRRTRSTVSRPHSGEAVSRGSSRTSRRQRRDARSLLSTRRNVSKVDDRERLPSGSC